MGRNSGGLCSLPVGMHSNSGVSGLSVRRSNAISCGCGVPRPYRGLHGTRLTRDLHPELLQVVVGVAIRPALPISERHPAKKPVTRFDACRIRTNASPPPEEAREAPQV